jgi:hypothetical protein
MGFKAMKHSEPSLPSDYYFHFIIFFSAALISLSQETTDTQKT